LFDLKVAALSLAVQIATMKARFLFFLIIFSFLFQACNRAMSPYEAANHPKGKKCRNIR